MHVHLEGDAWNIMFPPDGQFSAADLDFNKILFPYIANGVTTVQVMFALPDHIQLRERIRAGEILGPRLIHIGGNPCRDSADSPYSLAGAALLPAGDTGLERCRVDHQRSPWWPTSGPPSRVQRHFMAALPVSLSAACQPIRAPFGYET